VPKNRAITRAAALILCLLLSTSVITTAIAQEGRAIARIGKSPRLLAGDSAGAQVLALVIGIDAYQNYPHLKGAVADARDIEGSLLRAGIIKMTTLIDAAVTREAVTTAMERLIEQARSGDLVIITYAGHGSQEPARVVTADNGGKDEVFILAGFAEDGPGQQERILDKEIFAWLSRLDAKGATVIFLADSCHGGGMSKDVDPRNHLSYRSLRYVDRREEASGAAGTYYIPLDQLIPAAARHVAEGTATDSLSGLTFIGAVDKWDSSPEVAIQDEATLRGAVSYAFARAIEGRADRNRDGQITRRELMSYIAEVTKNLSESKQDPIFAPRERLDKVAFALANPASSAIPIKNEVSPSPAQNAVVRIGVLGGAVPQIMGATSTPFALSRADSKSGDVDAVWDFANGDVVSSLGDIIARGVGGDQLPGVVDRIASVRKLASLARSNSAHLSLVPSNRTYRVNEVAHLQIEGVDGRYLVIANISGNGKIQFVYPIQGDQPLVLLEHSGDAKSIGDIAIKPPLGSEVMVAVASRARMPGLEDYLVRHSDQQGAREFVDLLEKIPPEAAEITFLSFFTAP
jgi:hypothetical protein